MVLLPQRGLVVGAGLAVTGPLLVAALTVTWCQALMARAASGRVVVDQAQVAARIAIVLGAGLLPDGSPTGVLARRVEAAAALYRDGVVELMVMSGGDDANGDQPLAMSRYAAALGVPADRIELDRDGIDTAATCRVASRRYPGDTIVLVTQEFHARRTAYLARKAGLDAVVLATPDAEVRPRSLARARARELPASVKAALFDRV
jgi:vancomycin permeability regulator SanA